MTKSMALGGGGKFQSLVNKVEGQGKPAKAAGAIAASIGDKKYGKQGMEQMAQKGKLANAFKGLPNGF